MQAFFSTSDGIFTLISMLIVGITSILVVGYWIISNVSNAETVTSFKNILTPMVLVSAIVTLLLCITSNKIPGVPALFFVQWLFLKFKK
jgi:hypothetical protein